MIDSELKIIIAFLFKRSGKEEMPISELYLPISMDLQWFNPKQAKDLINLAKKQKLLIEKDSFLKPSFNYKEINVPIGFHPSQDVLKEEIIEEEIEKKEIDVLIDIVKIIIKKTGNSKQEVIEKINKIADEKNITNEIAALLLCKEHNIDVEDFIDNVKKSLFK
jgi:hypothetical protein